VGFTGCLIDDHVPRLAGDEGWAPRAGGPNARAVGDPDEVA
jgi:hypothetical protein